MSTIKLYSVIGNPAMWPGGRYAVFEGKHPWWLGNVECNACGLVWGDQVNYPWVDLSSAPEEKALRRTGVCSRSIMELEALRKIVAPLVHADVPLPPGTTFGQFNGRHTAGELEDFNFYLWNWMITRYAYERLRERGALSLGATPAQLRNRKGQVLDYVELHVIPRARLGAPRVQSPGEKYQRYCPVCGFDSRPPSEPLVIDGATIPMNEEIIVLQDAPRMMFCVERFMEGVKALGLSGIEFRPVTVV